MLSNYRQILGYPGAALFSGTALVARLPIAMVGLGIVLLVEDASGSYGLAGAISGAHLLANALLAVPQGRLIDRFGQSRVLPLVITLWGVGLSLLIWAVESQAPLPLTYLLAGLAGACLPSVGTCVRARWAHVLAAPRERQTAFALEGVADETVFISGPILVTFLATALDPAVGLVTAIVVGVLGTLAFTAQRGSEPPAQPSRRTSGEARAPLPWPIVVPLAVVGTALGTLFGAAEVTTVAFSEEMGNRVYAGPLLALWAAGSLVAGVLTGAVEPRRGPLARLRLGAAGMTVAMTPLVFIESLALMGAVLFVGGLAIAPTLIAAMSLAEQSVPASRLTEGMAFVHTGIVAGVAPGAVLAGLVIDSDGASPAYLVCAGGGAVALLAALAIRATVPRDERIEQPVA